MIATISRGELVHLSEIISSQREAIDAMRSAIEGFTETADPIYLERFDTASQVADDAARAIDKNLGQIWDKLKPV